MRLHKSCTIKESTRQNRVNKPNTKFLSPLKGIEKIIFLTLLIAKTQKTKQTQLITKDNEKTPIFWKQIDTSEIHNFIKNEKPQTDHKNNI